MRGLSSATKGLLGSIVDSLFDNIAMALLGRLPSMKDKKLIAFTASPTMTLAHLFVESMGNKMPMPSEQEAMKNMLSTAHDYVEALKSKTKARVASSIESYVQEERNQGRAPSEKEIKKRVADELSAAGKHIKLIAEAEGTKARNLGSAMTVSRIGASQGIADPMVFFVVVRDGKLCSECKRLHLLPDGVTPKVWRLSELGFGYHKKGEPNPKISGIHPHCRCTMTYLAPGFSFKDGRIHYAGPEHNELDVQRGVR